MLCVSNSMLSAGDIFFFFESVHQISLKESIQIKPWFEWAFSKV